MNNKLRGSIFVFLGACSFGILSTMVKQAYAEGFTLGNVIGCQAFFGMLFLWIAYGVQMLFFSKKTLLKGKNAETKPTSPWKVMLAGVFTGSVSILYYQSVKLLPASVAIILLMQYLWISMLLDAVIYKKKPTRIQLIAVFIVLIGTFFAAGIFGDRLLLNVRGVIFGLFAALAYAIFILVSGRVGNDLAPLKKSALMITGSCLMIFTLFTPTFLFDGALVNGLLFWGVLLAIFGTFIPPLFFSIGIPKAGVTLSAILSAIELPTAVLFSHVILNEEVNIGQWFGVGLILSAIVLSNLRLTKKRT